MIKNPDRLLTVQQYIQGSKDFVGYWNYLPFVFIVKTYLPLATLRSKLQALFPNGGFLVAEVSPAGVDGMLPNAAWDWFNYSHGQLSLGDLFTTQASGTNLLRALGSQGGLAGILGDPKREKK
jgi:hypothetical protein